MTESDFHAYNQENGWLRCLLGVASASFLFIDASGRSCSTPEEPRAFYYSVLGLQTFINY